jgi:hypothetical protein
MKQDNRQDYCQERTQGEVHVPKLENFHLVSLS